MSEFSDFLKELYSPQSLMEAFGCKSISELKKRLSRTYMVKMPNGDVVLPEEALARRDEWGDKP